MFEASDGMESPRMADGPMRHRPWRIRTREKLLTGLATVVFLSAGCSPGESEGRSGPAFLRTDSAGIEMVEHRRPLLDEAERWEIEAVPFLQVGAVEGEDPYLFRSLQRARRLPDGRIVLVEDGSGEVRLFDASGAFERRIGRPGDGPGEYSPAPVVISFTGDTIVIWDHIARRLSYFDPDGVLLREESWRDRIDPSVGPAPSSYFWDVRPDMTMLTWRLAGSRQLGDGVIGLQQNFALLSDSGSAATALGIHL